MAALGLAGFGGYEWPRAEPSGASRSGSEGTASYGVQSFVTRPDLLPPTLTVTVLDESQAGSSARPRYIFVSPKSVTPVPSQAGLMIIDRLGRLIWFQPVTSGHVYDLNAQGYRGSTDLTWWADGAGVMADGSYRVTETIHARRGLSTDLHELFLTASGTALITAYENTTADLSAVGGPRRASVVAGHVQEIDPVTRRVLFDWNSLAHVGVEESYAGLPSGGKLPYDYFHLNSVGEAPDGNLIISARNTWAVYKLDRSSGRVIWRMNGKRSDFTMGPGTHFYWQHDARMPSPAALTLFDDGGVPAKEPHARGLLLAVNSAAMHVSLERAYSHPAGFVAENQGSMQLLPGGRVFVGWGSEPYFSEFAPDGRLLLDGQFPAGVRSYRAYTHDWVGRPGGSPSAAVRSTSAGPIVYASWNGATEISTWSVLAGKEKSSLETVGSERWTGFETAITVNAAGPYYRVTALDAGGRELGSSAVVEMAG